MDITPQFRAELKRRGIKETDETLEAKTLKPTQNQLIGDKVAGIEKFMETAPASSPVFDPIFVTRDHYIIDGHHRWAAQVSRDTKDGHLGDVRMKVRMLDMEIGEAIDMVNAFAKVWGIQQVGTVEKPGTGFPVIPAATISLSTPIVSSEDGPRMSGFAGKKAAPFVKGGGRSTQHPNDAKGRKRKVALALRAKSGK